MTREEAIQWLKVINKKEFGWDEFALQESQREIRERCEQGVREAIDMAIEALSVANIKEEFESVDAEFTDLPDIPRYYYEKVVGKMAHEINMLKEQLESADADRPQGEWEERYIEDDDNVWTRRRFYCSVCGRWNTYGKPDYCPKCGAQMRREDE